MSKVTVINEIIEKKNLLRSLYRNIANVMSCSITFADNEARDVNYEQAFKNYTFADGTPFGVKIE